jgi:hypothetical protein
MLLGDVGKLLKDFVSAFFSRTDQRLLILQHIKFDHVSEGVALVAVLGAMSSADGRVVGRGGG